MFALQKLFFVIWKISLPADFYIVVPAAAAPNEALSSDDFEMINNDLSTEGADNDGKIYLWIIRWDPDVIELIAIF